MEGEWRNVKHRVSETLSYILQTGLYTDLTFTVGRAKHKVNAHKLILMARSEVFAVMLQDRWDCRKEDLDSKTIHIPDVSLHSFHKFLEYLYTDGFDESITIANALEVLQLAHLHQVSSLISKCYEFLNSKISVDNCVDIFQGTRLYEDKGIKLSQVAFNFLTTNIGEILQKDQFLNLDVEGLKELLQSDKLAVNETELFKAILSWSKVEESGISLSGMVHGESQVRLNSLIHLIRFPLMGAADFAKTVVPTKLLSDAEALEMLVYFNGGGPIPNRFLAHPRASNPNISIVRQTLKLDDQPLRVLARRRVSTPKIPIVRNIARVDPAWNMQSSSQFSTCSAFQTFQTGSTPTALPIDSKNLKFHAQILCLTLSDLKLLFSRPRKVHFPGIPYTCFRLTCDKSIKLHGLRFYGPLTSNQFCFEYDLKYTISDDRMAVLAEKELKVVVSTVGQFSLLLDEPLQTEQNKSYWVNLTFGIKEFTNYQLVINDPPSQDRVGLNLIRLGRIRNRSMDADLAIKNDGITFEVVVCPDNLLQMCLPESQTRQWMQRMVGNSWISNNIVFSSIIESVIYS